MRLIQCFILIFFYLCFLVTVDAGLSDYINNIGAYFGYSKQISYDDGEVFSQRIPYEVSTVDDKFLAEAAKLTGVALSELDTCQQRVVLKLKSDCDKMNDEQVAKMAVHLLNCQSYIEGRRIYPCTDEMSIRDCTTNMDSDTWTSYHLMSNRARAVCYTIRQSHFRGLAEHTVNRLMDATQYQLKTLGIIADNQENVKHLVENTYKTLSKGHDTLSKQQEDIQKAQFHGQLVIEDNIKRLVDEKRLILETHNELVEMTKNMHNKLGHSLTQIDHQNGESKINHKELMEDLLQIQKKVQNIFKKIDESSNILLKQNEDFKEQYESTLKNLQEVNKTVHNLVTLVSGTRQALEERLAWITTALGGTDLAIDRLYLILWHAAFMLLAMLTCAFLSQQEQVRFVVAVLPPLNLAVALLGEHQHLEPVLLAGAIGGFILVQTTIFSMLSLKPAVELALPWVKERMTPNKNENHMNKEYVTSSSYDHEREPLPGELNRTGRYKLFNGDDANYTEESTDVFKENFSSLTPPISRNGHYSARSRSRSRSSTPLQVNGSIRSSVVLGRG
ncbi:hypothetical protein NQ317_016136 [Molorchus minor]|uniref:Protein brambleberry n=1 Tax=Molorchus minor TaxID=1323400 RepID=A0ABQ9IYN1_9CUCU|nr:hypothetical protein NQ317_016136 [Molorchus minor]